MKELEELIMEIREKLPRLRTEMKVTFKGNTQKIDDFSFREPMLNDVLNWLTIMNIDNVSVEFSNQEFSIVKDNSLVDHFYDYDFEGVAWDLSKPYLKDQSHELIKFLHSLIKTKQ